MEKIKSSKVAVYLNPCFQVPSLQLTPSTNIDASGEVVSNASANSYTSDFFRVRNGATITICGNTSKVGCGTSTTYIAFYDKDKNLVFANKNGVSASLMTKQDDYTLVCTVDSTADNADEIAYCRVTIWASGTDVSARVTDWARMGKGIVSLPLSYGAKTSSETYINEDNASTSVDGYEVATDVEQTAMKGDPIFDYVDTIRKELFTGSECETQALIIPIYELEKTSTGYSGTAQKFGATIAVTDFELNGGEIAKIKYKVSFNGTPENIDVELANGELVPSAVLGTAAVPGESETFPTEPEDDTTGDEDDTTGTDETTEPGETTEATE